jgi:hypothetical protein
MPIVYALNIRWVKSKIDPQVIDSVLNRAGDWFRFNSWSWLLASDYPANDIVNAVKSVLTPEDSVFIVKCDLSVCGGIAPQMTWDWVNKHRNPTPANAFATAVAGPIAPQRPPLNPLGIPPRR